MVCRLGCDGGPNNARHGLIQVATLVLPIPGWMRFRKWTRPNRQNNTC